ncbi:hypothetical protein BKA61DRAFT_492539 [Leptodontidium sp. MPI-SDFR-AT-0119]|nr:hypothetical protein BKA61DRAFT_492539 [Leptodontidium sp. MPI-SDFR-AT-0119]
MGSSSVQQQQQVNGSEKSSWQPSQRDFLLTPDHLGRASLTLARYSLSSTPQRSSSRPLKQSPEIIHTPSNRIDPILIYNHPNVTHDRPFRCDQCPQSFNRNHDLKRHRRIHLTVKPFPCLYCEKSFSRKDALKRHIRVKGCGENTRGALNANEQEHTVIDSTG